MHARRVFPWIWYPPPSPPPPLPPPPSSRRAISALFQAIRRGGLDGDLSASIGIAASPDVLSRLRLTALVTSASFADCTSTSVSIDFSMVQDTTLTSPVSFNFTVDDGAFPRVAACPARPWAYFKGRVQAHF